jgi:hypothetical protein
MPQSIINVAIHFIFSTKNRVPFIDSEINDRLFKYMGAIWTETGGKPILTQRSC